MKTNQILEVETNNPFGNYVLITSSLFSFFCSLNVSNPLVCSFLFSIITNLDPKKNSIQKYKQHQNCISVLIMICEVIKIFLKVINRMCCKYFLL